MKTKLLIFVIFVLTFTNSYSQNIMYKGNKKFNATGEWEFKCSFEAGIGNLEVQIARNENGGYLKLSADSNGNWNYIGGNVYVFLEDGTKITCTDKGIKDEVDQRSVALYSFSNTEMEQLRKLDILKIRFTIKAKRGVYGSSEGNYTAENKKAELFIQGEENIFDTSASVNALFEE